MAPDLAMSGPLYTVFTPTYQRANTLHRVYDSLCAQTCRDFEWLVVDDGSTDGTDALIRDWAATAHFNIRYVRQANSGKHVAYNRAIGEARGQFFAVLDSDDALMPGALQRLADLWQSIPEGERPQFSGVGGLCVDQNGTPIGDRFPSDPFDADLRTIRYIMRMPGERWGVGLTEIVRQYPFPEIPGTQFIPEGVVWLEIAKRYRDRYTNDVVRIYHTGDAAPGETLTARAGHDTNAAGRLFYYAWLLNNDFDYVFKAPGHFLKAALMLPVVGWHAGRSLTQVLGDVKPLAAKALVMLALPAAAAIYALDKVRRG